MTRPAFTVLLLGALALQCKAAAESWTVALGKTSTRASYANVQGPQEDRLLWSGGRPSLLTEQAVCWSGVLVTTRVSGWDAVQGSVIVAQDLATGAELWAAVLPFNFPNPGRSRAIAVRHGLVYATRATADKSEYLYALRINDGTVAWRSQGLVADQRGEGPCFADDGDLIIRSPNGLTRVDSVTGATVWATSLSTPAGSCGAACFGNRVYVWESAASGPRVRVIDAETGTKLYASTSLGLGNLQQTALLIGPDGTVYAPRNQEDPDTDTLIAFTDTGSALVERWRAPLGFVPFGSLAATPDGTVYSYATWRAGGAAFFRVQRRRSDNGSLVAESGAFQADYPVQPRIVVDNQGWVYLTNGGYDRGRLYVLRPDLTLAWSTPVMGVGLSGPLLASTDAAPNAGTLVVTGEGSDVRAYLTAAVAWVSGTVTLQQRKHFEGMSGTLEFRVPGTLDVLTTCPVTLGADGTYSGCEVPPGTYDLAMYFPHFLRRVKISVTLQIGENEAHFDLINGDADGDNVIGLGDLTRVLVYFHSSDAAADRDGDGIVGLYDLNTVLLNFGRFGDP